MATNVSVSYQSLTLYSEARQRAGRLRSLYFPMEEVATIREQARREIDALLADQAASQSQRDALAWLRVELFRLHGHADPDEYEYKRFEIEAVGRKLYLITLIGRKNDEGTAAIITRDHRMIAIGPRGGLQLLTARCKGKVTGKRVLYERSY